MKKKAKTTQMGQHERDRRDTHARYLPVRVRDFEARALFPANSLSRGQLYLKSCPLHNEFA